LVFLWLFSLLEIGVVFAFRHAFNVDAALGWPYLLTLAVAAITAVIGLLNWVRLRPTSVADGPPVPKGVRAAFIFFFLFVGYLGVRGMLAGPGGATEGKIFPDKLTLFTVHGFAALYLCLQSRHS
jgi:hypothetical protein